MEKHPTPTVIILNVVEDMQCCGPVSLSKAPGPLQECKVSGTRVLRIKLANQKT